ncbi:MAG: bifunctional (p)ppGpp synthetase/guanosine-3',5'-bis(diphosphate) 3'-pyrophosphohydrolase [Mariprofundaceae bacterium]|nr:bifunctional (p)ppGpp synthetase/guanosine-3',5'-bis(diphosphate) 3'-pyrophosphohydrolase [Mariprofundaceae bacterium]
MSRIFEITEKVSHYGSKADVELLNRAYVFAAQAHAEQRRSSGELYITHPLAVADILASLKLDVATVVTGLLHDTVEDTHIGLDDIRERFGEDIAKLVDGVTKIGKIHFNSSEHKQAENFRKMILATAKDLRVLLVKLADRMHNMRTLGFVSKEKARRISEETIQIHAPLAHRLGIHWIKQEMEDIAFSYIDPEGYALVKGKLKDKLDFLQQTQANLEGLLQEALSRQGLEATVQGRMKHLYSLHQKMQRKHIDFEEIYDIVAFRLIVKDAASCYQALGIIHSLYRPVPGRFKDYIALPKPNGYQSLHTSVIGPENHRIEVQIRAESMHRHAEDGVAAHWLYKDGDTDALSQREFLWLSQLTELLQEAANPNELMESVRLDLFVQEVYVFSRDGDIYALPRGARPLDFAYAVHTDIGHHSIGVRINGEMRDFQAKLHNGDQIEILTSPDQEPSSQWLKYVKTPKARQAIRQYYRRQERETSIHIGMDVLNEVLIGDPPRELLQALQCDDLESLQEKLGRGDLSLDMLLKQLDDVDVSHVKLKRMRASYMYGGNCCYPIPGDSVLGRVVTDKGMELHYRDCKELSSLARYRWLEVDWQADDDLLYPTGIEVRAENRRGMLAKVSACIAKADANIDDLKLDQRAGEITVLRILVSVHDRKHLATVLKVLKALDGVVTVKRQNQVGLGENYTHGIADVLRGMVAKGRRSLFKSKSKIKGKNS